VTDPEKPRAGDAEIENIRARVRELCHEAEALVDAHPETGLQVAREILRLLAKLREARERWEAKL
jgi:hypothetical protein